MAQGKLTQEYKYRVYQRAYQRIRSKGKDTAAFGAFYKQAGKESKTEKEYLGKINSYLESLSLKPVSGGEKNGRGKGILIGDHVKHGVIVGIEPLTAGHRNYYIKCDVCGDVFKANEKWKDKECPICKEKAVSLAKKYVQSIKDIKSPMLRDLFSRNLSIRAIARIVAHFGITEEDAFKRATRELPETWAEVVKLRGIEKLSVREVASALGLSRQRVSQLERSAIQKLYRAYTGIVEKPVPAGRPEALINNRSKKTIELIQDAFSCTEDEAIEKAKELLSPYQYKVLQLRMRGMRMSAIGHAVGKRTSLVRDAEYLLTYKLILHLAKTGKLEDIAAEIG